MASVSVNEHNYYDCTCNGDHWILVHDSSKVYFKGVHAGLTSSGHQIEYFDSELEMEERIVQLGLVDDYPTGDDQ